MVIPTQGLGEPSKVDREPLPPQFLQLSIYQGQYTVAATSVGVFGGSYWWNAMAAMAHMEKIYIYIIYIYLRNNQLRNFCYSVFCESGYSLPIDIKDLPETMVS